MKPFDTHKPEDERTSILNEIEYMSGIEKLIKDHLLNAKKRGKPGEIAYYTEKRKDQQRELAKAKQKLKDFPFNQNKSEIIGNVRNAIESAKGLPKTRTMNEAINSTMLPKENYFIDCYYFALKELKLLYAQKVVRITSENLIQQYNKENPEKIPSEPRVWGAVMGRLSKEGLIIGQGWTTYQNPLGHGKPSRMWIVSNKTK